MKYKLFISILFLMLHNAHAQLPDPSNSVIVAKLQEIITQNQIGFQYERKKIVEAIRAVQQGAKAVKEIKDLQEYMRALNHDMKNLKIGKILDPDRLESFIMNGDRIDFYFQSTTRKLMDDIYLLSNISMSGNKLIDIGDDLGIIHKSDYNSLVENQSTTIGKIDYATLEKLKKIRSEATLLQVNTIRDMELYFALLIEQAKEIKRIASDDKVGIKDGDRAKLQVEANKLIIEATKIHKETVKNTSETSKEVSKQIINNQQDLFISQYFKKKKTKRHYGFFDSQHIKR